MRLYSGRTKDCVSADKAIEYLSIQNEIGRSIRSDDSHAESKIIRRPASGLEGYIREHS